MSITLPSTLAVTLLVTFPISFSPLALSANVLRLFNLYSNSSVTFPSTLAVTSTLIFLSSLLNSLALSVNVDNLSVFLSTLALRPTFLSESLALILSGLALPVIFLVSHGIAAPTAPSPNPNNPALDNILDAPLPNNPMPPLLLPEKLNNPLLPKELDEALN